MSDKSIRNVKCKVIIIIMQKNLTAFSFSKSRSDYNNSNESFSLQKHKIFS